jgi:methyltransferase (TIGR00027 family)
MALHILDSLMGAKQAGLMNRIVKMNILNDISETALITLKARVIEAKKEKPLIQDDMGVELMDALRSLLPTETRKRIIDRKLPLALTRYTALRARKYDNYAREFIEKNPKGMVVSLGCGFDTRYWRVFDKSWPYVEIDLAPVIRIKKDILKDKISYSIFACSVLDGKWIEEISTFQNRKVLFLAEGLLMYLPQDSVERLFKDLSETFSESSIVFEAVNKKYTKGIRKKLVETKMRRRLGNKAGAAYQFGVNDASEIEFYGKGIRVMEEWSFFEDQDLRPKYLRLFKKMKLFTRTQWTIKANFA